MTKRYRSTLLIIAWLAYMVFTIAGHPFFGISVMLPSILLCGFASWLYDCRIALITILLTHLFNMLVMMYNHNSFDGWRIAIIPEGLTMGLPAQLFAVLIIAIIKSNRSKRLELTANLETRIQHRKKELKEITEYMIARSEAERSRMSETLCTIVAQQQTGLFYHSEALMNSLVNSGAPQADAATKLVQIARQNVEQVKNIARRLSPQKITEAGIEQALHEMCAYFTETADTDFTIIISDHLGEMSEETSLNIYRIAHEAVTNALRHAKATHIDLALRLSEKNCTLEIINNGNPIPCNLSEGLGMKLIQKRADILKAMTRLETTSEGQTRFECVIPLYNPPFHCSGIKY